MKDYQYIRKTFTYKGSRYTVRGKTEEEAAQKIAKKLEQLKSDGVPTVTEWFQTYIKTYKSSASKQTIKDYNSYFSCRIEPYIGAMQLGKVKPIDCQRIMIAMNGLSKSYIHKVYILLCGMFETATNNDLLDKSPCRGLKPPKGKEGSRRALYPDERRRMLAIFDQCGQAGLFCKIIYYCGLRPSEVCRIRSEDLKDGILTVRGTKTDNAPRAVPIPPPMVFPPFEGLLFHKRDGKQLQPGTVQSYWETILRNFGETDLTMYCLRHDYCTRLQEADIPLDTARRLMGHSTIAITSQIYTHSTASLLTNAAQKLSNFYCDK